MKIIDLNEIAESILTCDSTLVTADSTIVTADMTLMPGKTIVLKIIPRAYFDEVEVTWYDELRKTTFIETCLTTTEKGFLMIPYIYKDFVEGSSLEVTIKTLAGELLHRTKAYATFQEDLENYKLNVPNNNGIIKL